MREFACDPWSPILTLIVIINKTCVSVALFRSLCDYMPTALYFTLPSISCFCQKGAQVSFAILPLHCPEEKSGRAECGGILQTAEREAQVHQCTFFIGSHESVFLYNKNLLNSFLGYVWRANTLPTRIMSANYFNDNKALILICSWSPLLTEQIL